MATFLHAMVVLPMVFAQAPTEQNYQDLLKKIVPAKEELGWRSLDWHVSLWDAVQKAKETKKPILLYAMNGHPLACT